MIDTHTHIYLPEFDNDRGEVISRAKAAGISTLIMPAIDASTHEAMMTTEEAHQGCFSMMGLHPCSVTEDYLNQLITVQGWLERRKFVAIGEIGLDFFWDKTFLTQQYDAFNRQIEIAVKLDLPIVIHSRDAIDECIAVVEQYPGLTGVFHCFSGNLAQALRILDCGFYLGIGGVVTFKNGGVDKVIEKIGFRNMVLETDAPYLAPVPHRGKRNEPSYTRLIAEKIAAVCSTSLQEVEAITNENAKKLFRL